MQEKWEKIKSAIDELYSLAGSYAESEMDEGEEESCEDGTKALKPNTGSSGAGQPPVEKLFKGDLKVGDKVSIASAIIKKKMGI